MVRLFLCALLLLFSGAPAFALVQPVGLWESHPDCAPSEDPLVVGKCGIAKANGIALSKLGTCTFSSSSPDSGSVSCFYIPNENYIGRGVSRGPASCPANSTAVAGGCQCNSGSTETGGSCAGIPPSTCGADTGKVGTLNFTEGYTRTPDEGDRMAVVTGPGGGIKYPPADGNFCQKGCNVSAQISGPGVQPLVSQYPTAQGLYRRSLDLPTISLGTPCTANDSTDAAIKPDAPPPDCPGAVGEVNGRTSCVGTAAKPVYAQPLGQTPGAAAIAGNPTAGPKPASGEGSGTGSGGRTPTAGDGANGGGPSGAAVGGKGGGAGGTAAGVGSATGTGTGTSATGTGTTPKPAAGEEQAACGAPGQPKCAIDETGTPDGKGAFDAAKAAQDKNAEDSKGAIEGAAGMQGPSWSFSFQLPTGCTPYQVASFKGLMFSMNPCAYQSTIHDLMSMLWAAATAMCLIGMVGKTIREA